MSDLARLHAGTSRALPWISFAVLAMLVPALYATDTLDISTINKWGKFLAIAIMAIGLDLVWGYTGMLSLCQSLFFTLGGYCFGMYLAMHGPLDGGGIPRCLFVVSSEVSGIQLPVFWQPFSSFWAAIGLTILVPGVVAFVFGWFAFRSRVKGVYFSIITQALTIAFWLVFCRNEMHLCGTNGLTNWQTVTGFDVRENSTKLGLYFITVLALVGVTVLAKYITNSRAGRILVAIRDNESRLRFAGYQPVTYKVFIFVLGAILGGIGGALYSPQNTIMNPVFMKADVSVEVVVMVALGGRGTIYGAVIGAILFQYLKDRLTTTIPEAWLFVLGGLFVTVVLLAPDGIVGLWRKLGDWLRRRDSDTPNTTVAAATA